MLIHPSLGLAAAGLASLPRPSPAPPLFVCCSTRSDNSDGGCMLDDDDAPPAATLPPPGSAEGVAAAAGAPTAAALVDEDRMEHTLTLRARRSASSCARSCAFWRELSGSRSSLERSICSAAVSCAAGVWSTGHGVSVEGGAPGTGCRHAMRATSDVRYGVWTYVAWGVWNVKCGCERACGAGGSRCA
eukprot:363243-Chlamydomonas_euryale.AAC.7